MPEKREANRIIKGSIAALLAVGSVVMISNENSDMEAASKTRSTLFEQRPPQEMGALALGGCGDLLKLGDGQCETTTTTVPGPALENTTTTHHHHSAKTAAGASTSTETAAAKPAPPKSPPVKSSDSAGPTDAQLDSLAQCEATGDWSADTGNGYYGGLQFDQSTWEANGGLEYAQRADLASPSEQKDIARNTYHSDGGRGWSPWPSCSEQLGLR